jgi:putative transposase
MDGEPATGTPDLAAIPDEQWAIARRRFEVIRPLLEQGAFDASAIVKRAGESAVHRSTLYRWLSAYLKTSSLDSLLPRRPGPSLGVHGLIPAVEAVIESSIEDRYLTRQRLSPIQVVRDVHLRCRESGLDMPSESTVRRRLTAIPSEVEKRRREGYRAAQAIAPLRGASKADVWIAVKTLIRRITVHVDVAVGDEGAARVGER